jgi:predicted dehydrogenase
MKVGILGAGRIAEVISNTLRAMAEAECYAIASRTLEKAQAFASEHGFAKAYGSYEELLQDPEVELVYIATPHSHHYECMKMCIRAHKPVLCEKSFTVNAKQAREIAELATKEQVFVTEAIWPRYMPSRSMINEVLASGVIGNVKMMTANLSYVIDHKARIVDPALAGGALLDVGVYGINFMLMHLGKDIERIESTVQMTDRGVDGQESITVTYKDGTMAVLTHGIFVRSDRKGIFYGDKGYVIVENINNPECIEIYDTNDNLIEKKDVPAQITGYEYEFLEAKRCLEEGKLQSDSMPLEETVYMMELMDGIRKNWGLVYPGEE